MIHFTNHHLPKIRLNSKTIKRRVSCAQKALQTFQAELVRVRKGSKISRFFRHLFEQRKVKAMLGGNLAILVIGASVLTPQASALTAIPESEITNLSAGAIELTTRVVVRAPVEKVVISQGYHRFHPAVDLDGKTRDPIYPIMKGKVEAIIYHHFGLGTHIILDHGSGLVSIYAHLSQVNVKVGQEVDTDHVIGLMGSSGRAFGDHLHLEVIDNGQHISPFNILPLR